MSKRRFDPDMPINNALAVATSAGPHLFWITSRAAGIAAVVAASLSVCMGLLMGGRLLKRRIADLRVAHEALSLTTIGLLLVHGVSLLGDGYAKMSVADIALPFAGSYKTFWTSAGIVAFWGLLALGISYYARAHIGQARWRRLHRFTALAWLLGLVHALGEGTDAGQAWFLAMIAIVVAPALALLVYRHLAPKQYSSGRQPASRQASPAPGRTATASAR
jgi:methionine sulfoxide reductase heme-binding subunit